jgi:hypothetical protein
VWRYQLSCRDEVSHRVRWCFGGHTYVRVLLCGDNLSSEAFISPFRSPALLFQRHTPTYDIISRSYNNNNKKHGFRVYARPALRGCGACGRTGPPKTEGPSDHWSLSLFFPLSISTLDINTQE